jgi:RNA polymerase-binding transcription factor DksA
MATRDAASSAKPAKKAAVKKAAAKKAAANAEPANKAPAKSGAKKVAGIKASAEFDVEFLTEQREALIAERVRLTGQANRLEDEANSLIEEAEMGDVQFDEESGEGDTMVVERERDLALSAQARQTIVEIDAALLRIADGTYGYSSASGRPIPRERLEALPWTAVLVEEKVGGLGRR